MKLLVVSHLYPTPTDPVYGVFVHREAVALSDRGHDVRVVSPTPYVPDVLAVTDRWQRASDAPDQWRNDGIPVSYARFLSLPSSRTQSIVNRSVRYTVTRSVKKRLRRTGFDPDLIVAHTLIPDGYATAEIAEELDIPLVVASHGADVRALADDDTCRRQAERAVASSELIVFNSDRLRRQARELLQVAFTGRVVPKGYVKQSALNADPIELPAAFDLTRITIVSVGTINGSKGQPLIFEAIRQMSPDCRPNWLVVGDGPDKAQLQSKVENSEFGDLVQFTGNIPNEDVFRYLKASDAMVLPSSPEAFGIVYVEAMACGLPVIACQGEGPAEYVEHEQTGLLLEERTPEALAQQLRQLADEHLRQTMGEQGRQIAESRFTWDRVAEQLELAYDEVIDRNDG